MKKIFLTTAVLLAATASYAQQKHAYHEIAVNYDEDKVPQYTLPDLLTCTDGSKVKSVRDWEAKRRPELLEIFMTQQYGRTPQDRIDVDYKTVSVDSAALGGKAVSQQVMLTFSNGQKQVQALLLVYVPKNAAGKVPVIFSYNFDGNHTTNYDTNVRISPSTYFKPQGKFERGSDAYSWSYKRAIGRGYAVATVCRDDITPDNTTSRERSVASLFPGYSPDVHPADEWGSIGIWAWGASRVADYLETQEWVDTNRLVIMGHSRLAKAALWAGVQDDRFKIVISTNSGCGGAALYRRAFGENAGRISHSFPYWFCPAFQQYSGNEAAMPFDQHELLALIAPRRVYVASAEEDLWADPRGEFLSAYHASPVYKLYGLKGIRKPVMPQLHRPIMNDVGYHIRAGVHDVLDYDWQCYLDYCDKYLNKKK